jgi:hypothetical protein
MRPGALRTFVLTVCLTVAAPAASEGQSNPDHRAWLAAQLDSADRAAETGEIEAAAAAYLRVFTQIGSARLLWGRRAETPIRDRALAGLLAVERPPPMTAQVDHFLNLARRGGAGRGGRRRLIAHWTQLGLWDAKRDRALTRRLRDLRRPRRKRRPWRALAADHAEMNPLRDALNRERVLMQHAIAARDGRTPLLMPSPDVEVAESLLEFAALRRRPAEALALVAAVPVEDRPKLAWPLARVYLRMALEVDLPTLHTVAQQLLLIASAAPASFERPVDLALSRVSPWSRAVYFSAVLDAHAGSATVACASWRELVAENPHGYYGVLARARIAAACTPISPVTGTPEVLWAQYLTPGGRDVRTPRFDRPDPRPTRATLPKRTLPPTWMLAVARQESGLRSDLCSPSGACGLFQLKPGTARTVQKDLGWTDEPDLANPEVNAAIAAAFLRRLESRCGSSLLALAAYNAGPHAVARWDLGDLPGDLALELVPSARTRAYARGITVRYGLYASWLDQGALRTDLIGHTPIVILRAQ